MRVRETRETCLEAAVCSRRLYDTGTAGKKRTDVWRQREHQLLMDGV